jgi:hypothetical protein
MPENIGEGKVQPNIAGADVGRIVSIGGLNTSADGGFSSIFFGNTPLDLEKWRRPVIPPVKVWVYARHGEGWNAPGEVCSAVTLAIYNSGGGTSGTSGGVPVLEHLQDYSEAIVLIGSFWAGITFNAKGVFLFTDEALTQPALEDLGPVADGQFLAAVNSNLNLTSPFRTDDTAMILYDPADDCTGSSAFGDLAAYYGGSILINPGG